MKILQSFLSKKEKLEICFMFDTKEIFENINKEFNESKLKYKEIKEEDIFTEEINEMNTHFFNKKTKNSPFDDIFYIIKTSISGYLIKQSYCTYNKISNFIYDKYICTIEPREITNDEIIELKLIKPGNQSRIFLPSLKISSCIFS